VAISYVFPNVFPTRGNFPLRCESAHMAGCSFVEIPAHFIRGKKEIQKTKQEIYSIPSKESVHILYGDAPRLDSPLPYILHTEPIITRRTEGSRGKKPGLHWSDPQWRSGFITMLCNIAEEFGTPAAKIEIHPGERKEIKFNDILDGASDILVKYTAVTGAEPEILLENRTAQAVRDGQDIVDLFNVYENDYSHLSGKFGIVLDIQQLSTVTRENFFSSFHQIPDECLKGFHIHRLHGPPASGDGIPWDDVFRKIAGIHHDIIINPEIHHRNKVTGVIGFCNEMLRENSPE
jgi:hypothetical protein